MADSHDLSKEYLAEYHRAAKSMLPGSWHDVIHATALSPAGGKAKKVRRDAAAARGDIPGGGEPMPVGMNVPPDMMNSPGQAIYKADGNPTMVAYYPPPDVAAALHPGEVEGAQDIDNMHMTLIYLGDVDPADVPDLCDAVKEFCDNEEAFPASVSGVGRFLPTEALAKAEFVSTAPGTAATYASVDGPKLPAFRQRLVEHLRGKGMMETAPENHGFSPHISLAATPVGSPSAGPWDDLKPMDMTIDHVTVASGPERHRFPLGEPVDLTKAEMVPFEVYVPICKAEVAQRLVTGVVMVPAWEDSWGDVLSKAEIERTAHAFMREYNAQGIQHAAERADGISVVESWIAPCDLELEAMNGDKVPVPQGTWLMTSHVAPDDAWERVLSGDLTGFSMQGWGIRTPIA